MTITVTVRANQFPVCVSRQGQPPLAKRLEPHSSEDFTVCDRQTLSVREIHDDGAGERPVDLDPDASE